MSAEKLYYRQKSKENKLLEKLYIEQHRTTANRVKKEADWREMDDEQWDKMG